jgi:hypothetical protein
MFQLLQRASAGNGRAMRTYQQYDEFAARRLSRSTELQFDDDLGSGLIDHSQNMTAAAMQIAEK